MHAIHRRMGAVLIAVLLMAGAMAGSASAQVEPETIRVNVITCVDPDCADTVNIENMVGATVSSHNADSTRIDSCTVTLTPSDMVDCSLVPAPSDGWYEVSPAELYSAYTLVSTEPEVFQSEMHGPIYVWYFAPPKDNIAPPPTQAPAASVTELPSTGNGVVNHTGYFAAAALGIGAAALAATAIRSRSLAVAKSKGAL